jgi:chaperonin GroEL
VAFTDAASVASLLITTEAMIAEKPKASAGGGMGGMDFSEIRSARS